MMREFLLFSLSSLIPIYASAQAKPPWEMSEEQIKFLGQRVSAGKSFQPETWPDGARVAVLFSFDIDSQTWELMTGAAPSITDLSQGEYGPRVGLRRIVRLLDRHAIPASFFVPVATMMLHPAIVPLIRESGRHEFGVHGWIHEHPAALTESVEEQLLRKCLDYFEQHAGVRPVGYRAPGWDISKHTMNLLAKLGFLYDSSLMADDRPYEIRVDGKPTGLEFDRAYEEGTMFLLTMHPRIMGHRSRIVLLEGLISYIKAKEKVWFGTHQQAADYVKACCLK